MAWLAPRSFAERDSLQLGTGADGSLTVSTSNLVVNADAKVTAALAVGDTAVTQAVSGTLNALSAPFIELVNVGNPGNPANSQNYGAVSYPYSIGKYEVTLAQYTAFLNAVAATDPYGLYNPGMATDLNVAGISRSGSSGSYTYAVIGSGNRPVTYVSWFDAARFINWLANGQPTGAPLNTTTENGTYLLNGVTTSSSTTPTRNAINPNTSAAPTYWIPTENEWVKAAYYDPTKGGSNYWLYPTRSDMIPGNNGPGTNRANFSDGNGLFSVTQSATLSASQNYLTDVGSFGINSASYYGTFDQGGNVSEWNDAANASLFQGERGSSWTSDSFSLQSLTRTFRSAKGEGQTRGFRVASSITVSPPAVTNVTSSTTDGSYKATQSVSIDVTFSASVTVTGTPTLTLNSGGTATYASGSPGTSLTFNYTVGATQNSADLDYSSTTSLALAGGTINATSDSTPATLTLPATAAAGSLGFNKAIVIDTTAPTIVSINRQLPSAQITSSADVIFLVTYSESVVGVTTNSFQVIPANGSNIGGTVTGVSGTGNTRDVTVHIDSGTGDFRLRGVN